MISDTFANLHAGINWVWRNEDDGSWSLIDVSFDPFDWREAYKRVEENGRPPVFYTAFEVEMMGWAPDGRVPDYMEDSIKTDAYDSMLVAHGRWLVEQADYMREVQR